MRKALRCLVVFFVGGLAAAPSFLGALAGITSAAFVKGFNLGFRLGTLLRNLLFGVDRSRWGPGAVVLFIPAALLGLAGCGDDERAWYDEAPAVVHEANGFRFGFYGPRASGYAADVAPSLEAELVTVEEIGGALEAEAVDLAARTGLQPAAAVAMLRSCEIRIVDDYNFAYGDVWASGLLEGGLVILALWRRCEAPTIDAVPLEAPAWTVRAPDFENVNYRFGGRSLVPAADHELGHVFFGPRFEH